MAWELLNPTNPTGIIFSELHSQWWCSTKKDRLEINGTIGFELTGDPLPPYPQEIATIQLPAGRHIPEFNGMRMFSQGLHTGTQTGDSVGVTSLVITENTPGEASVAVWHAPLEHEPLNVPIFVSGLATVPLVP